MVDRTDQIDREGLLSYAQEQFGAEPEHLWAKYPNYVVLRHGNNRKWYAAIMDVPRNKLGLPGEGTVDVMDVKCGPLLLGSLLGEPGFLPAYHMNKSNWVSVLLDGSVPREKAIHVLTISYDLTKN